MKAPKTVFVCQECGSQSPKWVGRCADCGAWNSFVEERPQETAVAGGAAAAAAGHRYALAGAGAGARLYSDIEIEQHARISTGIDEFDRVLGGGVVPGSLVLLGGEPGIGKSTLLLQAAAHMAQTVGPVLYSSGEESEHQIKSRGERLAVGARAAVSARGDLPGAHPRRDRTHQAGARDRRFGADRLLAQISIGARQHRPGARGGDPAAVRRQGPERADVSRRPRDEGRQPRRTEGARARRRHRAVLRRRAPSFASRRPRRQEPVRRDQRARRLRDDGHRTQAGAEPVEDVSRRAADQRAGLGRALLGRRLAADPRRSAGARQHEQLRHRAADGERDRSAAPLAAAGGPRKARRPRCSWATMCS